MGFYYQGLWKFSGIKSDGIKIIDATDYLDINGRKYRNTENTENAEDT